MEIKLAKCLNLPASPSYPEWEGIKREFDGRWKTYHRGGKITQSYIKPGDIVEEAIVKYFASVAGPKTYAEDFVQCGKWCGNSYDKDSERSGQLYMTFKKAGGHWIYFGTCFAGETKDRQHYEFAEDMERCFKWDFKTLKSFVYSEKRNIRERNIHYLYLDWRYVEFLDLIEGDYWERLERNARRK